MTAPRSTAKVLPHEPLEQLAGNLWRLEGALPEGPLRRVMVIARLHDGGLLLHNPIMADDPTMRAIEALGAPRVLVVPNGWHRLDAPAFHARFPEARVVAPAAARRRVQKVVPVDATYEELPRDASAWLEPLDGLGQREGVLHVRSEDGVTLVFADAVFNLPARFPGLWGFVYHDVMGSKPGPRVTRVGRLALVRDRRAFRDHLERLADLPDLRRVIVAHGAMEATDARGMLRRAAATL